MSRLSFIDCTKLNPEQQVLFDSIVGGPRAAKRRSLVDEDGHLTGVFNGLLLQPALGTRWSALGEALRFHGTVDRRYFELCVLTIATFWRASHEWIAHVELARQAGISDGAIAALEKGETPSFDKPAEAAVYNFVHELLAEHFISDATYKSAAALFSESQLFELVSVVGYYSALAMMLNGFEVRPPKDFVDPWPAKA